MNIGTLIGASVGALIGVAVDFGLGSHQPGRLVIVLALAGGFLGYGWWEEIL